MGRRESSNLSPSPSSRINPERGLVSQANTRSGTTSVRMAQAFPMASSPSAASLTRRSRSQSPPANLTGPWRAPCGYTKEKKSPVAGAEGGGVHRPCINSPDHGRALNGDAPDYRFRRSALFVVVPRAGLEPARPCEQSILSAPCLPFHHPGWVAAFSIPARPGQLSLATVNAGVPVSQTADTWVPAAPSSSPR